MATVFLVELDTGLRVRDWVATATAGVYTRTLSTDMHRVEAVSQDGTTLAEKSTSAAVDAATGSWTYDAATRVLRVHTTDDGDAGQKTMLATVLEPLLFGGGGGGVVKDRSGVTLFWDNRVLALPSILHALPPDEPGAGAVASFGTLEVANLDGRYDRLLGQRLFSGYAARIYKGEETDAYTAFSLWAKALMELPGATTERCTLPLVSLARKLDAGLLSDSFSVSSYPNLDPNVDGIQIPRVWGTVVGAQAFRIASSRWKVAGHAVTSIDAVKKADGTAVTLVTTDVSRGEFTVGVAFDTEDRLYVDCRGFALDTPGELFEHVAKTAGIAAADIDSDALATLDTDRAVNIGFQVLTGSVREVFDLIARSAFVDWSVTRTNQLSARVRKRDQGNLVTNGEIETDTAGWSVANSATIARVTSPKFRGVASLRIVKPAAQGQARAVYSPVKISSGKSYTITLMAAVTSGTTTAFRVALADSGGSEVLSDDITLSATDWTRVTKEISTVTVNTVYCDSTTVFCDSTTQFVDGAGRLWIYPQYGGAGDVTVAVDDVEVAETVLLDDTNARYEAFALASPIVRRVRVGYAFDGRTGDSQFLERSNASTAYLFPTAETREVQSHLVAEADALVVAEAMLAYLSAGRMRASLTLFSPEQEPVLAVGSVLNLQTGRTHTMPGGNMLHRITRLEESYGLRGARMAIEAEGLYEPIFDLESITPS